MRQIARGRAEVEAKQGALVRSEKLAAIGELAASVGHELRNPLAAVKGGMAYLSRRLATVRPGEPVERDPKVKEFLELAGRELGVCNRIISELLDFARDSPPQYEPCPLHSLVSEALGLVPARQGVSLVNSIPEDLPVPSLDKDQFRRVIVNLAQNASEAMGERGGHVEVLARGGGDEPLVIEVRDDGPGIPADILPHVFQPLFTTKTKGTGLGLAIVANMVNRHRGSIHAASEVGKGSRFVITLPQAAVRQAA
jgi:signal transduction histidine kinase